MRSTIKPGLIVSRRYANSELQRAEGFEPVWSFPAFLSTTTEAPNTLTSTSTSNAPAAIHHETIDASVSTDRTHAGGTMKRSRQKPVSLSDALDASTNCRSDRTSGLA
jgi:hypothetical protein